jgi:hypothetical protein
MENFSLLISIGMEVIFAIVTILIAYYSLKIYKISYQKELKLFGIGFISIAFSYVVWILLNFGALTHIASRNLGEVLEGLNLLTVGAYANIILFIVGLAVISFVTLKSDNFEYLALLISLSLAPVMLCTDKVFLFYVVSIIFFAYLAVHHLIGYIRKNNKSFLMMTSAFVFLSLGTIMFIFSGKDYTAYVVGHIFSFVAYILLLVNLIQSLKHGKKTK